MTDDDAGVGKVGKNGDFWMTSFVNDPLNTSKMIIFQFKK